MPISPTGTIQYIPQGTFSNPQQGGGAGFPPPFMMPQPGFFRGTPSQVQSFPRFTGQQQDIMGQLMAQLGPLMQQVNKPLSFDPFEQKVRQQFSQQTVPGLAERFVGLGGGRISSPDFARQVGEAGAGMDVDLAAARGQFDLGQRGQQLGQFGTMLNALMQPQFEQQHIPGQPSGLGSLLSSLAPAAGQLAGAGSIIGLLNYFGLLDQFKTKPQKGAQ